MDVGLIAFNWDYANAQDKPFQAIRAGIERIGHKARVCVPPGDSLDDCKALFVWQASKRKWYTDVVAKARERGAWVFVMERGWLDRYEYTQFDHVGFNHTASWAHKITLAAPSGGVERYRSLCERLSPRIPVESRPEGYALILGQTGGDTQLRHSEIHHADALCGAVKASLPAGLDCAFRRHPLSKVVAEGMQNIDGSLEDALKYARFVITINSNAGNDAMWAGVPVLCLGPALYEMAGVARRTSVATLLHDMEMMCRGWQPDDKRVLSYFHWLASKQWNSKELEQGDCLEQLLGEIDG